MVVGQADSLGNSKSSLGVQRTDSSLPQIGRNDMHCQKILGTNWTCRSDLMAIRSIDLPWKDSMPVNFSQSAVVSTPGQRYALSSLVTITPGGLPEYLVLTGFDFDRYTAASQHSVGVLTGDGKALAMGNTSIVFTYTNKGFYSSDIGYLSALSYVASTDNNRSEYLSVYGYGSASTPDASQFAALAGLSSAWQLLYTGSSFLGSLNVVTRSNYTDATPNLATPDEIATVAASFVGKVWSDQGCWVLVSNIAAAAGASLPVSSAVTNDTMSPVGNGEWLVAYDSTKASAVQQKTWQLLLRPGDIVDIAGWCTNHVTTVVAGKGYAAMTIDNRGVGANDGAPGDSSETNVQMNRRPASSNMEQAIANELCSPPCCSRPSGRATPAHHGWRGPGGHRRSCKPAFVVSPRNGSGLGACFNCAD